MARCLYMDERAIEKLGGAFKLTVLLQKRVREIIRGANPLVPVTPDLSPIDIALKEILDDKIGLGDAGSPVDGESDQSERKQKKSVKKK